VGHVLLNAIMKAFQNKCTWP